MTMEGGALIPGFGPARGPVTLPGADPAQGAGFEATLARISRREPGAAPPASEPPAEATAKARRLAEQLVAAAFVRPILAQMRSTNAAWGPFAPGAHEKQFAALHDAEAADRLVRAARFPIVDALARHLLEHTVAKASAPPPTSLE